MSIHGCSLVSLGIQASEPSAAPAGNFMRVHAFISSHVRPCHQSSTLVWSAGCELGQALAPAHPISSFPTPLFPAPPPTLPYPTPPYPLLPSPYPALPDPTRPYPTLRHPPCPTPPHPMLVELVYIGFSQTHETQFC
jgi:hypothetical protein